jgi:hypothetical protein
MVQPLESSLYLLTVLDALVLPLAFLPPLTVCAEIANAVFNQTLFRYQLASMLLYIRAAVPLAAKTVAASINFHR